MAPLVPKCSDLCSLLTRVALFRNELGFISSYEIVIAKRFQRYHNDHSQMCIYKLGRLRRFSNRAVFFFFFWLCNWSGVPPKCPVFLLNARVFPSFQASFVLICFFRSFSLFSCGSKCARAHLCSFCWCSEI